MSDSQPHASAGQRRLRLQLRGGRRSPTEGGGAAGKRGPAQRRVGRHQPEVWWSDGRAAPGEAAVAQLPHPASAPASASAAAAGALHLGVEQRGPGRIRHAARNHRQHVEVGPGAAVDLVQHVAVVRQERDVLLDQLPTGQA